jgi:hypothetical protein
MCSGWVSSLCSLCNTCRVTVINSIGRGGGAFDKIKKSILRKRKTYQGVIQGYIFFSSHRETQHCPPFCIRHTISFEMSMTSTSYTIRYNMVKLGVRKNINFVLLYCEFLYDITKIFIKMELIVPMI